MSYTPTNWVNGSTPLNATNMNKIEQGIAAVDTGKQDKIPTITISEEQYISENPIKIQFTDTQASILENDDNYMFILGDEDSPSSYQIYSKCHAHSTNAMWLTSMVGDYRDHQAGMDGFQSIFVDYNCVTKIGIVSYFHFEPTAKTSAMTQAVGIDIYGGLWTTPSSSSTATTASLTVAGWSNNSQTVSVTGVTASNNIIVAPAPASQAAYTAAGIICTAQENGTLTFTCTTVPTEPITVNVLIVG